MRKRVRGAMPTVGGRMDWGWTVIGRVGSNRATCLSAWLGILTLGRGVLMAQAGRGRRRRTARRRWPTPHRHNGNGCGPNERCGVQQGRLNRINVSKGGAVRVQTAVGWNWLSLRGGGGIDRDDADDDGNRAMATEYHGARCDGSQRAEHTQQFLLPGAGVALWLDDDPELIFRENEFVRRQYGGLRGSVTGEMPVGEGDLPDDGEGWRSWRRWEELVAGTSRQSALSKGRMRSGLAPTIYGEIKGQTTRICGACCKDIPVEKWSEHGCESRTDKLPPGPGFAVGVKAMIEHWESITDHDMANGGNQASDQHNTQPATSSVGTGCHGYGRWTEDECQQCGLPITTVGTLWRVCRCTAIYCERCSVEPCVSCAALGQQVRVQPEWPIGEPMMTNSTCEAQWNKRVLEPRWTRLSPDDLSSKRANELEEARAKRKVERTKRRVDHKALIKEGKKLRRERTRVEATATFCTVNATCAESLKSEIKSGSELKKFDFVMIQEHGLREEQRAKGEQWMVDQGWDAVLGEAYIKTTDEGGGTGIMASSKYGVRPAAPPPAVLEGRLTLGTIHLDREVTAGSWYGISGGNIKKQFELWQLMAERIRALGRPFIIGGDWQVRPNELRQSGLPELLNAKVCAPVVATNSRSGRTIDYFLVSEELADCGWEVYGIYGTRLATHIPVGLKLQCGKKATMVRRLSSPRMFPAEKPVGPMMPQVGVAWENWQAIRRAESTDEGRAGSDEAIDEATETWFAGAEQELVEFFGLSEDEAGSYRGIGARAKVVEGREQGRFRHTADYLGIAGHRSAWVCRSLHLVSLHAEIIADMGDTCWQADLLRRMGHFAGALKKKWAKESASLERGRNDGECSANDTPVIKDVCDAVYRGLRWLERINRRVHRQKTSMARISQGQASEVKNEAMELCKMCEEASTKFAITRSRKAKRETMAWVKMAKASTAHRATKEIVVVTRKSASARKDHKGERTAQDAADCGREEWAKTWKATEANQGEPILEAIEAMYCVGKLEDDLEEVLLPPLDSVRLARSAASFKSNTGIGTEHLRPRHVVYMSASARASLARLLATTEKLRRWPSAT